LIRAPSDRWDRYRAVTIRIHASEEYQIGARLLQALLPRNQEARHRGNDDVNDDDVKRIRLFPRTALIMHEKNRAPADVNEWEKIAGSRRRSRLHCNARCTLSRDADWG